MRLRSWLLAGTGLAALAMLPASAYAQQAEYQALLEAQASGDAAAVEAAQQALTEACITANFANLDECIAAIEAGQFAIEEAQPPAEQPPAEEQTPPPAEEQTPPPEEQTPPPAEEQAPPVEEQAPPPAEEQTPPPAEEQSPPPAEEQAAPPEEQQPSADDAQQQFLNDLQTALNDYQAALNQAAGGDYEGGKAAAADAEARALALCQANGYPDITACIGQPLPPLPEAPAAQEQQPAEQQTETPPAAEEQTQPADEQQAPAETDPQAEAIARLQQAAELYTVGAGQLDAGDPAGQSTVDAANNQFAEICAELGVPDVAQCLAQYGITLPPLPEAPVQPTEPQGTPISELPGAEEEVTPDATEVLPETQSGGEAAPILDSAKDTQSSGETPPTEQQQTEEPPAPPPASDKDAQSALAPTEIVPIAEASGEKVEAAALPPVEVPPSVTIINNTIINNTNITNNNAPAEPPKPGNKPDYANNGFIFNIGVNLVISNPAADFDRITDDDEDFVYYERLPGGRIKETVERPNGVKVVTIRNRYGEILKRSRITPDGREYILAYYDEDEEDDDFFNWRDPGDDLPPLRLTIPIREYILDADEADEEEVELFFRQPPVEKVRQIYTIDDVKRSARLRDSVRRIEVGGLTFDSGKATIAPTQVGALSKVANAMLRLLEDNPAETFLIEGHTDAVGPDEKNLVLSDARASTVARILTDFYGIPPENLVTQGYGERYLKVKTELTERLNRRVSIKRITSLITVTDRD